MNREQEEKLKLLAGELAQDIKTGEDLSALSAKLVKLTVEAALSAELENHLGYPPHALIEHHSGNSRNGSSPKILKGSHGEVNIARTDDLTHLAFHPKRGRDAIEEIGIINEFTGTLVRDGFVSYRKYEQCRHSSCKAHLLRDLTFIGEADTLHRGWTSELAALLLEIKASVELAQSNASGSLDDALQNTFSTRYDRILAEAETVIRYSPELIFTHLSAGTLRRRFVKNKELILRFMTDFRVPFDNNGSERDLRMLKLQQKISGCFRSVEGAQTFCRVRSYLSSVRKQGRSLLTALEHALNGKPIALTGSS